MLKDFSKIIDNISKIKGYQVLKSDPETAIIATKIILNRQTDEVTLFNKVRVQKEVEIDTFFLLSVSKTHTAFEESFKDIIFPILILDKKKEIHPLENLQQTLDDFVLRCTRELQWKSIRACL